MHSVHVFLPGHGSGFVSDAAVAERVINTTASIVLFLFVMSFAFECLELPT